MADDILQFKEIPENLTIEEGKEIIIEIGENKFAVCKILKLQEGEEGKDKKIKYPYRGITYKYENPFEPVLNGDIEF